MRNDGAFLLAVLWTLGFLGLAFLIVLRGVPDDSKSEVQQLMSIMSMIMAAMAGYFYGASKSNTETAVALAAVKKTNAPADQLKADDVNVQAAGDVNIKTKGKK